MYPKMNLSCAFSIVVLFVTAVNSTSTSAMSTNATAGTSASNTTTAITSTPAAATNTTASNTSTTTTSLATTPMARVCIEHTCNILGCLANATNTKNCTDTFCTMVQSVTVITVNQTSYNVTAGCRGNCTEKDEAYGNLTVRTRCCQTNKCNNNDAQIVALPLKNGGSASYQTLLWILSIMLFIFAFEILF